MKKTKQIKLRLERETLRTLHDHELRRVDGGAASPVSIIDLCPPPPLTGDSQRVCCA